MIALEQLTKVFGDHMAVDHLDLQVDDGELCVLVGPSGSGKTTTMRMINRLVEPTSGRIFFAGEDVTRTNPVKLRRHMGYVIQQVGLFPHLTVSENVGTVPRLLGWDRKRARARVLELLDLVGLDAGRYADRYPHELSGGQRQRVGVARALGADPPVLLMDEPFGALDPITRARLQDEFLRLQRDLRKTVVFVTHDIEEAVHLGDRIAILDDGGRLAQHDTPAQVLGRPASDFVAGFVGADRGLKRLSVTSIAVADLDHPPAIAVTTGPDAAMAAMRAQGRGWAIVVADDGTALGHVTEEGLASGGTVRDRVRPLEAHVEIGATLKDAFVVMLSDDAGWVAVLDRGRYLGVLTPETLHAALRRSIAASPSTAPAPA